MGICNYETTKVVIPIGKDAHRDKKATLALNTKILEMLGSLGPNDLFVFYDSSHSMHEHVKARFGDVERPSIIQ